MELEKALEKLGIDKPKKFQRDLLDRLLKGQDVVCIVPTGSGKSLVFQLLALLLDMLVVVIEPHLALELDQVKRLREHDIPAAYINSLLSEAERKTVLEQVRNGSLRLLYLTPEMLQNKAVRSSLRANHPCAIMIDEAHCVVKQGSGFREDYLRIHEVIKAMRPRPVVGAFTATATPRTEEEIIYRLNLRDPYVCRKSITRDNITLSAIEIGHGLGGKKDADIIEQRKRERICKLLDKMDEGRAIIYCNTVNKAKKLRKYLKKQGYDVGLYHGKCKNKQERLNAFWTGEVDIMVCTNAFGLGVDIPDIRLVIHHSPLMGLDDYVQEVGRAGRDGKKSKAVLLWHLHDFTINRSLLNKKHLALTGQEYKDQLDAIEALENYAKEQQQCRWRQLRRFFGEEKGTRCKNKCDVCKNKQK